MASLLDRKINVFTCVNDPSVPPVALIEGVDMVFRAPTAMQAKAGAEAWRREAVQTSKGLSKAKKAELLGERA